MTNQILQQDTAMTENQLWLLLTAHQGHPFRTAKNLEFTYTIRGGEMFVDRRSKSITRATIARAYQRVQEDTEHRIQGPKALNCFGAPYVWALFAALGIVTTSEKKKTRRRNPDSVSKNENSQEHLDSI